MHNKARNRETIHIPPHQVTLPNPTKGFVLWKNARRFFKRLNIIIRFMNQF